MAYTNAVQQPDLEEEILSYIQSSAIEPIQGSGKSYINPWSSIHFTKGKYSNHITIQECTLQCIHAFLCFKYTNNGQIQLFYKWIKANPRQRTQELMKQIVQSISKDIKMKKNKHFHMPDNDKDSNESKDNNDNDNGNIEKESKPGAFGYEYKQIQTFDLIKGKSVKVYDAIIKLDTEYFVDLKDNHNIDLNSQNVLLWES